jgi:hypothetical protein
MKDDLPHLLNCCNLCRARTAIHLCKRKNRFHRAASRLWHRFQFENLLELLIRDGVFESRRIGRRLRLRENRLARLATHDAGCRPRWLLFALRGRITWAFRHIASTIDSPVSIPSACYETGKKKQGRKRQNPLRGIHCAR